MIINSIQVHTTWEIPRKLHLSARSIPSSSMSKVRANTTGVAALNVRFADVDFVAEGSKSPEDQRLAEDLLNRSSRAGTRLERNLDAVLNGASQQVMACLVKDLLIDLGFEKIPGFYMLVNRYVTQDTVLSDEVRQLFGPEGPNYGPEGADSGEVEKHRDIYLLGEYPQARIKMLVHPDRMGRRDYAEKRLVQKAIEAFQENFQRTGKKRAEEVFYGMLFLDTSPVFYKIPVNERLARVVLQRKLVPGFETEVKRFDPGFDELAMADPDSKKTIIDYLLRMKELLKNNRGQRILELLE